MSKGFSVLTTLVLVISGVSVFFISRALESKPVEEEAFLAPYTQPLINSAQAYILPLSEPSYIPYLDSNVPRPRVDAKAALVYDFRASKFLYQESINTRLPIASLTKIMSAVVVLEKLTQSNVVIIPKEAVHIDGSKQDLFAGEQLTVGKLLQMMLVGSSNDAASALAWYAQTQGIDFVAAMNEKAKALGMEGTHFLDPAGLNDTGYSTASDLIKLVRATLRSRLIWDTLIEKELQIKSEDGKTTHVIKNTDELLGVIPGIIGGKTGNTDGALGCLILIVNLSQENDTIISIVLGSRDRFGDTQKIVEWVKTAYKWQ